MFIKTRKGLKFEEADPQKVDKLPHYADQYFRIFVLRYGVGLYFFLVATSQQSVLCEHLRRKERGESGSCEPPRS